MLAHEFSRPILLGTSNPGKLEEIAGFADRLGFSVFGLRDAQLHALGGPPDVAETSGSYEGNARLKATAYARWAARPCIADDTGLELSLLGGLPGVHTAPWGVTRVEQALGGRRTVAARFVCYMVYCEPSGRFVSARGVIDGVLRGLDSARATGPLPYSTFFFPRGCEEPMSALLERGVMQSHRFYALRNLVKALS